MASVVAVLLDAAEDAASSFELAENEAATLAVILDVFRIIGAVCLAYSGDGLDEREASADAVRATARQVDLVTGDVFRLIELVEQRLEAGSSPASPAPNTMPMP